MLNRFGELNADTPFMKLIKSVIRGETFDAIPIEQSG